MSSQEKILHKSDKNNCLNRRHFFQLTTGLLTTFLLCPNSNKLLRS